jgi:hypothetical protein
VTAARAGFHRTRGDPARSTLRPGRRPGGIDRRDEIVQQRARARLREVMDL